MIVKNKKIVAHQPTPEQRQDFWKRLVSTGFLLVLLAVILAIMILSDQNEKWLLGLNSQALNYSFSVIAGLMLALMSYEIARVIGLKDWWLIGLTIILNEALFIFPFFQTNIDFPIYESWDIQSWFSWWQTLLLLIVWAIILSVIVMSSANKNFNKVTQFLSFSLLIVLGLKGFANVALASIGKGQNQIAKYGFMTVIWLWLTIIMTDTFSYIGGMLFGKHKLAPVISPKKTWEGAIIGCTMAFLIGSIASILVFYLVPENEAGPMLNAFQNMLHNGNKALPGVFLGLLTLVTTVWAQLGDLLFSMLKRANKVKDYSNLIPGHGGLLDRLDSFVFVFFLFFIITLFL